MERIFSSSVQFEVRRYQRNDYDNYSYHNPNLNLEISLKLRNKRHQLQIMLVIRIFYICPLGFEPVTNGIKAPILHGTKLGKLLGEKKGEIGRKVGPAGFEPATWRL